MRIPQGQEVPALAGMMEHGDHAVNMVSCPNEYALLIDWAIWCAACGAVQRFSIKETELSRRDVAELVFEQFQLWKTEWPESCAETSRLICTSEVMES